jgi:nitrogen fixation NifU-like protein
MAYSDKVLDHYENPRNVGSFAKDAEGIGTNGARPGRCDETADPVGADGRIEDAVRTYGCGSAIAPSLSPNG